MNKSRNNWSKLASKFAFAQNTSVNCTTGQTPYEIVFGTCGFVPMTLKLGLLRDKDKQCKSDFCDGLQPHTLSENSLPNISLDRLLGPQLSDELLKREMILNEPILRPIRDSVRLRQKHTSTETDFELGQPISTGQ